MPEKLQTASESGVGLTPLLDACGHDLLPNGWYWVWHHHRNVLLGVGVCDRVIGTAAEYLIFVMGAGYQLREVRCVPVPSHTQWHEAKGLIETMIDSAEGSHGSNGWHSVLVSTKWVEKAREVVSCV